MPSRNRAFVLLAAVLILTVAAGAALSASRYRTVKLKDGDFLKTDMPWSCEYHAGDLFCGYGPKNNLVVSFKRGSLEVARFNGTKAKTLFKTTKVR